MKKWGGKKPPSSASSASRPSFISQVSPFSWLSKFKQMRINSEMKHGKPKQNVKQNVKQNSPSDGPRDACGGNRGRFYGKDDDDAFWRLSFSEESHEQHKKIEDKQPSLYNLDHEHHAIEKSSLLNDKRQGRRGEERKLPSEEKEFEQLRKRYDRKSQRVLEEQLLKLERAAADEAEFAPTKCKYPSEKDAPPQFESPRTIRTPRTTHLFASAVDSKNYNSLRRSTRESGVNSEKKLGAEWQNWRQTEDLRVKTSKKRQSVHVSRELQTQQRRKPKHSPRVRVNSPRMASKVETCKIKAIEDMKKAKLKLKKKEEVAEEEAAGLDSFAVVKCSLDPEQDFTDSMIEMITEKKISQPEEMEELLACYLTLNSGEYHDLIIKVFREVWLYVSQSGLGLKPDKQCSCCD